MMRESLVRASVIRYIRRFDGPVAATMATANESAIGFRLDAGPGGSAGRVRAGSHEYPTWRRSCLGSWSSSTATPPAFPQRRTQVRARAGSRTTPHLMMYLVIAATTIMPRTHPKRICMGIQYLASLLLSFCIQ